MTETSTPESIDLHTAIQIAAQEIAAGKDASEVARVLGDLGVSRDTAAEIVRHFGKIRQTGRRQHSIQRLVYGAGFLAVGLVISGISYAVAPSLGGHYVVATGAVFVGGINLVRGTFGFLDSLI